MVNSCCVVGCHSKSHGYKGDRLNNGLSFHSFPSVKTSQGPGTEELTTRRRRAWVAAVRRTTITFEHITKGMKVCSLHFHKGKPCYENFESNPDWAPSLHLGHEDVKTTDTRRFVRAQERRKRVRQTEEPSEEPSDSEEQTEEQSASGSGESDCIDDCGTGTGSGSEQEKTFTAQDVAGMQQEINRLLAENRSLKEQLAAKEMTFETLLSDDNKLKYYTGMTPRIVKMLIDILSPHLPQGNGRVLSPSQMILVTFLRLRLDLPIQHIAYILGVHRTTVSNAFMDTMAVMYVRLERAVLWPERESLRTSVPHEFVEVFGHKVAVIVDCFEIFIERPSNLMARSQTFSHYKHNNTMKYMIGITPQGSISFLSKSYGGRSSDKYITEDSGFLDKLLPGDLVLADRGFDIGESVGMMCCEVKIPSFTRGQAQMHATEIESTRELAHLRIHVERVIGNTCCKYTILTGTIPISMVLPCEGENVTFLDKIVSVCCGLTNMSRSVVIK